MALTNVPCVHKMEHCDGTAERVPLVSSVQYYAIDSHLNEAKNDRKRCRTHDVMMAPTNAPCVHKTVQCGRTVQRVLLVSSVPYSAIGIHMNQAKNDRK